MPHRRLPSVLIATLFSFGLVAQVAEPAIDVKKLRAEGTAAVQSGDFDVAAAAFKKLTIANEKDGQAWHMLGYSLHSAGKYDDALAAHLKAIEFPGTKAPATYNVACVYALTGKPDEAFQWLDKAVAAGFGDTELVSTDSDLDSLRRDARFKTFVESMKKGKTSASAVTVYEQNVERRSARAAWFSQGGQPHGQIAIDYSPVKWQASYEEQFAAGKFVGQKWRLGADFWTRLDSTFDLKFGEVSVPAGYYYLTAEQKDATTFVLQLHDPVAVRKAKLDSYQAGKLKGGIEVSLTHATSDDAQEELELSVKMKEGSKTDGVVTIRFGTHKLAAKFHAGE